MRCVFVNPSVVNFSRILMYTCAYSWLAPCFRLIIDVGWKERESIFSIDFKEKERFNFLQNVIYGCFIQMSM